MVLLVQVGVRVQIHVHTYLYLYMLNTQANTLSSRVSERQTWAASKYDYLYINGRFNSLRMHENNDINYTWRSC